MKLNIDEAKFLAAVDREGDHEGDHEVGAGTLTAEIERLRAALRPFAEAADGFDMTRIKNPEEWFAYRGIVSATEAKGAITVGDLRRARAAIAAQPAPGKEDA